ncbi:hypothetical protein QBC39DRAFT_325799 [Podospora conica]|nr:hypothetical protein QBC39DRAFT_325799 [Schizothecium conicum]
MHVVNGSLCSVEVVAVNLYVMQSRTMQQAPQDYKRLSIVHLSECQRKGLLCLPAIPLGLTNVKAQRHLSGFLDSLLSSVPISECNTCWSWGIRPSADHGLAAKQPYGEAHGRPEGRLEAGCPIWPKSHVVIDWLTGPDVALAVASRNLEAFTPGNVTPTGDERRIVRAAGVESFQCGVQVFRPEPVLGPVAFNIAILSWQRLDFDNRLIGFAVRFQYLNTVVAWKPKPAAQLKLAGREKCHQSSSLGDQPQWPEVAASSIAGFFRPVAAC